MSTKIIVSYDGTANENDAIALGRVFAGAGAEVALAYVRHSHEPDAERERAAQAEAEELLERGAKLFGDESVARHVVVDASTPRGLRALAEREGADVVAFCSDSHTANGHISVGNSAQQLIEGGPVAVAIAPVGLAENAASADSLDRRDRRRRGRRTPDGRVACRRARRERRAGRERGGRAARRRLAPGGRAGSRRDQRLGGACRRDRALPGADPAARPRADVRPHCCVGRLARARAAQHAQAGVGLSESCGGRSPFAFATDGRRAPERRRARHRRGGRAVRSTATSRRAVGSMRRGAAALRSTVSWRR